MKRFGSSYGVEEAEANQVWKDYKGGSTELGVMHKKIKIGCIILEFEKWVMSYEQAGFMRRKYGVVVTTICRSVVEFFILNI
jgi:hypothetical protein